MTTKKVSEQDFKCMNEGKMVASIKTTKCCFGFVYLECLWNNIDISMLLYIRTNHCLLKIKLATRLNLETTMMEHPINIIFTQKKVTSVNVLLGIAFSNSRVYIVDNFSMCDLGSINIILGNTCVNKYGIEIMKHLKIKVIMGHGGSLQSLRHAHQPTLKGACIVLIESHVKLNESNDYHFVLFICDSNEVKEINSDL